MKFTLFGRTWTHWRLLAHLYACVAIVLFSPLLALIWILERFDPFHPNDWLLEKHREYVSR